MSSYYVKYCSIDTAGVNVRSGYITGAIDQDLKGMKPKFSFPRGTWTGIRKALLTNPKARGLVSAFCNENGISRPSFNVAWSDIFRNPEDQISSLHIRRKLNNKAGLR